jgi:hypothetical protein
MFVLATACWIAAGQVQTYGSPGRESCDAYSAVGPAQDQETADADCQVYAEEARGCPDDCEDDNTPESIHGSECNDFIYAFPGSGSCTSIGYANGPWGPGYYAELRCTCMWDFPG